LAGTGIWTPGFALAISSLPLEPHRQSILPWLFSWLGLMHYVHRLVLLALLSSSRVLGVWLQHPAKSFLFSVAYVRLPSQRWELTHFSWRKREPGDGKVSYSVPCAAELSIIGRYYLLTN
jgi:hypothetical protein